jgi:hypothetical protein
MVPETKNEFAGEDQQKFTRPRILCTQDTNTREN